MIVLVMALAGEAKPVRVFFRLQRNVNHQAFPWFAAKDLVLIQSGPGKAAAAAAVAYAAERLSNVAGFINFGICGHAYLDIGTMLWVRQLMDQGSGQHWDLLSPLRSPVKAVQLLTVDEPLQKYPKNYAVDMEASGFYVAARRFVEPKQIACLKVVSDNPAQDWKHVTNKMIAALVANHLNILEEVIEQTGKRLIKNHQADE